MTLDLWPQAIAAALGVAALVAPMRVAVLASHGGSILQAVLDACASGELAALAVGSSFSVTTDRRGQPNWIAPFIRITLDGPRFHRH